jgi:ribonuclease BN (tRNA processing enzyme)
MLVNDDVLFDTGPDTVAAAIRFGLDLAPLQALLITHPHTDHLDPTTLFWRRKGFVATALPVLHVYGSAASLQKIAHGGGRDVALEPLRIEAHPVAAFQRLTFTTGGPAEVDPRFEAGTDDAAPPAAASSAPATALRTYEVQTLAARHATPEVEPMFFALRQVDGPEVVARPGGAALLYATDTGPFPEETWAALDRLAAEGWRFDATVIDSTSGLGKDSTAHMNLRQMEWHQNELARHGLLAPRARRFAHHFSHNGTPPYEDLETYLAGRDVAQAYDGLEVTL